MTSSEAECRLGEAPAAADDQPKENNPTTSSGLLFVLSGPSGVGKDTVISQLKRQHFPLHFTCTMTTRPRRPGEVDGANYFFVSELEFREIERRGELLESAVVHGHHYGTPKAQVSEALKAGKDVLLKIDVQGAVQVKRRVPDAIFIFLAPPSIHELVQRLSGRGTESAEEQAHRLRDACDEMGHLAAYDYVVVNPDGQAGEATEQVKSIIVSEKCRVHPRRISL